MEKGSAIVQLKVLALFGCVILYTSHIVQAQVVINEVVASNSQGISDEDGDYPDWIEFYNPTSSTINLAGFGISDDANDLFKFTLPNIEIPANEYYLVFASDKNRAASDVKSFFWETVIRQGDATQYIIPTAPVSSSWIQSDFDDSGWENGSFGIGYGDNDDATIVPIGTGAVFTRTKFIIDDLSVVDSLLLHIDFDDGYVAYINGVEISRFNLDGTAPVPFDTYTNNFIDDPTLVKGEELQAIPIDGFNDLLVEGENILAIQVHNYNAESSDLSLIPFLSIARNAQPNVSRGIAEEIHIDVLESNSIYPHLNFKLSSDGESVYLSNPDSTIVDQVTYPFLKSDESFGRSIGNDSTFLIFDSPTPLAENTTQGFSDRMPEPEFLKKGGVYNFLVYLQLADPSLGNTIYFTTDGNEPTLDSEVFGTNAKIISNTSTYKFKAIEEGKIPSSTVTHTFIIGEDHDLPIVSVTTPPNNLWSDESGIYVRGTNGIDEFCSNGPANWNQDWEIPINIELFETDGSLGFNSGAGAKIFGGCSRTNPAKSLAIYFRGDYGNSELNYKLFEEKDIDTFQSFVLRNSGNDFTSQGHSMFRDGLMKTLIEDAELDYQAFKPAVMYLNGEYWGIHNIREKINEHFIESNSNADSDGIDLLESKAFSGDGLPVHGTADNYNAFKSALGLANLNDIDDYQTVEEMIDIDNYIDYMAAQIYYANTDWPGNNMKYWRPQYENAKWRWIIYDTDFGFGLSYGGSVDRNTLDFALDPNGPGWPNPPYSTYIFRRMTSSDIFVNKFVNRMADLMNTSFEPEFVNSVIDSLSGKISNEIPRHINKWGNSLESWEYQISVLRDFANNRRGYIEQFMIGQFGLSTPSNISINVSNDTHGSVKVNRITPSSYPWSGRYFSNVPIQLTAIPKKGFIFTGWSESGSLDNTIDGFTGATYTANFAPAEEVIPDVVINEIMYNSSDDLVTGDWIELYNATDYKIDLSGWILKDEDDTHEFRFQYGTDIPSNSYLVVSADLESFNSQYDDVSPLLGEMGYNLAGGSDQVRLYDNTGAIVDSVQYSDEVPWDSTADGTGYTLELIDPMSDNSLPTSWKRGSQLGGTPGSPNTVIVSTEEQRSVPSKFSLKQNFPNPFNPSTNITFELPNQIRVKLTVYDMLGRRVSILTDEVKSMGTHTVSWDASEQSSGVYIYKLETASEVFTKKMLLIK